MEFVVGDPIMLSMLELHMHDNHKFAAHFVGPFKVLKHISKLAYHIDLPPLYSALHNVFYMSLVVVMGLVPMYSRFWLIVKNSMRSTRLWQNRLW